MDIKKVSLQVWSKVVYYTRFVFGKTPEQLWKKKLTELLVGVPEDKLKIYKIVLNNQHQYNQHFLATGGSQQSLGGIDTVRIAKLVLDKLTTMDLISVQPMIGPVNLVLSLIYKGIEGKEDNTAFKQISLEVVSNAIEACTRRFQTKWTLEAVEDLNFIHGIDVKSEFESAIAAEVATEISNEHIKDLVDLSEPHEKTVKSTDVALTYLLVLTNDIAGETRRGSGNWIVMDHTMFARLNLPNNDKFVPEDNGGFQGPLSLMCVGTLRETIKIYVNPTMPNDVVLVGYKGGSEIDAGLTYAPYVMLVPAGVVIDPESFLPTIRLMTRYGKHAVKTASAYYKSVKFKFEE